MYPDSRFGYWSNQHLKSSAESNWKIKEFLAPVTTRSGSTISVPIQPRFEKEDPPSDTNKDTTAMAALHEEDPEIGSLNAHFNGEPSSAIVNSTGQAGIEVKNNVLAVMPHFYGRREADTWFMRLPPNSIRTWSDFRLVFLEYFFPATRTNALKKEIQGATQEEDETLSQYWGRFMGMLDACPNNRMSEAEIYNNFYEGMTPECKDLVNSASGGDFSRLRVSEAKRILSRLINAKKAYDSPRTTLLRRGTVNAASEQPEDRMEARMDKLEKAIISALEKTKQPTPIEKCQAPLGKQRDAPWRDHPNFRWSDADLNQPAPQTQNFPNRGEGPSSWSSRNSEGTHQLGNRGLNGNANWSSGNQPNWSGRYQQENPADSYAPPHQRGFPGGGASQPPQGSAPQGRYNQGTGSSGNFHPQGQGYNQYQNQQGNSHFNQGHGYNQSASGSGQPFQRSQQKYVDNCAGDLLNNDVVNKLQDTQNEQKAALDMLARQLSQIATSISEMRGNEGRIPATVKMPGKEIISMITLQMNEKQTRPKRPLEEEESSGGSGERIQETEEVGSHKRIEEVASEESRKVEETEEVPNEVEENISMVIKKL
ncbi:hypothetical protein AAHA92_02703 [Salvia divinorum]|uniref:Retrotransposon gag domain-containing protein n=1 Tax=Salvia divinorum TaxID=28513 RepID=A0ABD1IHB9_SALDI